MRRTVMPIALLLLGFATPAIAGDATDAQNTAAERSAAEAPAVEAPVAETPAVEAPVTDEAPPPALVAPAPRQGFYLSLGTLGVMNANRDEVEGWLPTWTGWSSAIRVGEALNDHFTVGLAFGYGQSSGNKRKAQSGGLGLELGYIGFEPWSLRASVGLAFTGVDLVEGDEEDDVDGRFGELYSVSVSRAFLPFYEQGSGALAISPVARIELGPDEMFTYLAFSLGVEVSWWLGLSADRLELDLDEAFARD